MSAQSASVLVLLPRPRGLDPERTVFVVDLNNLQL
jgi:hypothetical protein